MENFIRVAIQKEANLIFTNELINSIYLLSKKRNPQLVEDRIRLSDEIESVLKENEIYFAVEIIEGDEVNFIMTLNLNNKIMPIRTNHCMDNLEVFTHSFEQLNFLD